MSAFKCKVEKEQGDGHIVLMDELQEANVLILVGGYLKLRQRDNDYCFSRRGAQDLLLFLLEWYGEPEMLYNCLIKECAKPLWSGIGESYTKSITFGDMEKVKAIQEFKESEEYKDALASEYRKGCIGNAFEHANQHKRSYSEGFKDGFVAGMEKA